MFDVGRIRQAALAVYNVRPGPASVLVLLRSAQSAMQGLDERREALSPLIAYEGAQQWDKDAEQYRSWLASMVPVAEQMAELNKKGQPPSPLAADRYAKLLSQTFTGATRAGAVFWATLANQMEALEGAQQDLATQTSWLVQWWAQPAANLAATIGAKDAYDVQGLKEDYAPLKEKAVSFISAGASLLPWILLGVGLYFGWPFLAPILGLAAARTGEEAA